MTLNITVASPKRIFQSADFRYTWDTGQFKDMAGKAKLRAVSARGWHATVCFNGVGTAAGADVSDWLQERLSSIQHDDPFARLYEEISKADYWLAKVPHPRNRHSFVIAGFNGHRPVYSLLTNYEDISGHTAAVASPSLTLIEAWPKSPRAFVSGQPKSVSQEYRWRLANLASSGASEASIFELLAKVNGEAATSNQTISAGCFTTCIDRTGGTRGLAHGIQMPASSYPMTMGMPIPDGMKRQMEELLKRQFPQGAVFKQFSAVRTDGSREYHNLQLKDKPNDPNTHCNYAAFLQNNEKDFRGAELAYRKAIALDDKHANALGNLANLKADRGEFDDARELYERALSVAPTQEPIVCNYAVLLGKQGEDPAKIREVLERSAKANPQNGRTQLEMAKLELLSDPGVALQLLQNARELGADQALVEPIYAVAMQLNGSAIGDCIAAYRTALAVAPDLSGLNLNLAQLLFIRGETREPTGLLSRALSQSLNDSENLEAQFYRLAHTNDDSNEIVASMRASFDSGARLTWNVDGNVETVRRENAARATLLEKLRQTLSGNNPQGVIDWPSVY